MRRIDKDKNMQKANVLAEQRYLESKGMINEGELKVGVGFLLGLDDELKSKLELLEIPQEPNGEEMTKLPTDKFHVTLTSIKSFKPFKDVFAGKDLSSIQIPNVELGGGKFVYRPDAGKVTYVLAVTNQDELKKFVDDVFALVGAENPEPDRFFHVTVANNAGGDSFKSIGNVVKQDLMEEETSDIQVWFDLDGVLADMDGALLKDNKLQELKNILHKTIESDFPRYKGLSNDEIKAKFKAELAEDPDNDEVRRLKKVFQNYNKYVFKIAARTGFYADLGLIEGGKELVKLAHQLTGVKPKVLSSPMNNKHSKVEKLKWVEQHFGGMFDDVILRTDKDAVVNSERDILIDDRTKYVKLFQDAGGSAILFKDAVSAGEDLKELVSQLKK
jgi:5'(3')-deoxyribonucleotidase